uniref:Secreted protein n=1 Tax=Ascaris lumbricoides TaxID=6252 RepID=A0A0M3HMI1_ASCLU
MFLRLWVYLLHIFCKLIVRTVATNHFLYICRLQLELPASVAALERILEHFIWPFRTTSSRIGDEAFSPLYCF